MKVVFVNRPDCFTHKGGDTNQMMLTKKYLESKYHLDITICLSPEELSNTNCDIIHLFNIQTAKQSLEYINVAIQKNIKIAVTPIYWDLGYSISYYGLTLLGLVKPMTIYSTLKTPIISFSHLLSKGAYLSNNYRNLINSILQSSDIILPNSTEEFEIIQKDFTFSANIPVAIIPNAIELTGNPMSRSISPEAQMVIQVGRVSAAKNQLGTLLALNDSKNLPLYFIGRVEDYHYYKYVKNLSLKRGNVYFIDEISSEELTEYYKKASVHVLPSFRESPGLVSLEAFYHGCEIVVSDSRFAPVKYYKFDEVGHVCNPYNVGSISSAIKSAFNNPKKGTIDKNKYFNFFNYTTVAEKTFDAYKSVLNV